MAATSITPNETPMPIPTAAPAESPWVMIIRFGGPEAGKDASVTIVEIAEIVEAEGAVGAIETVETVGAVQLPVVIGFIAAVAIVILKYAETSRAVELLSCNSKKKTGESDNRSSYVWTVQ